MSDWDKITEYRQRRQARLDKRARVDDDWVTIKGTHVLIDENGNALGGGKLKGQTFGNAKSTKKEPVDKGAASFKSGDYGKMPIPPSRYDVVVDNFEHIWNNPPTKEQAISMNEYGQHTYGVVNQELRSGKAPEQSEAADTIKNLDDYISSCNLPFGITVFRGAGSELVGGCKSVDEINEKMKGAVVQDKAFVSTSLRQDRAFDTPMMYEIKVPKGKGIGAYVGDHTGHEGEYEFLLARSSYFRVNGAKESNGKVVVEMEVVFRDE